MGNELNHETNISQFDREKGYKIFSDRLDVDFVEKTGELSMWPSKYDALPLEFLMTKLTEDPCTDLEKLLDSFENKNENKNTGFYFSILGTEFSTINFQHGPRDAEARLGASVRGRQIFPLKIEIYYKDEILPGRTILVNGYYGRSIYLIHFYPKNENYADCKPFAAHYGHFANTTDINHNYLKIRNDTFETSFKQQMPDSTSETQNSGYYRLIAKIKNEITIDDIRKETNNFNQYLGTANSEVKYYDQ